MIKTTLLAALAATALITSSNVADAQRAETVLVPASGGLGADMPDIAARMTAVIEKVARANGLDPKLTDASRDDVFAVAGCSSDDDPCHQAVLRTLGAKTLILVHVAPGTGTTIAEVEIIVGRRGKASTVLKLPLSGTTTQKLVSQLEALSPPAFGGEAADPNVTTLPPDPYGDPVPPDGDGNTLDPGEGDPFNTPSGDTTEKPLPPDGDTGTGDSGSGAATTGPTTDPRTDTGGGLDLARVSGLSWGVGGAGAGLVVTSFFFFAAASGKQGDIDNARANTLADIEHIKDLESTGKTYATLGNTTFLLGLVGLGVGGYLIYRDAKVPASEGVAVTPIVVPSGIGFGVTVRR